jgi:ferredoxin
MGRHLDTGGLRELMAGSSGAAGWDDVAARCLTCGNCTLACPTCFCTSVEDSTDLTGEHAERWELWDSCFRPGLLLPARGERPDVAEEQVPAVADAQARHLARPVRVVGLRRVRGVVTAITESAVATSAAETRPARYVVAHRKQEITSTDVGIRPFGYVTAMIVTVGLWLTVAPVAGAIARTTGKSKKS